MCLCFSLWLMNVRLNAVKLLFISSSMYVFISEEATSPFPFVHTWSVQRRHSTDTVSLCFLTLPPKESQATAQLVGPPSRPPTLPQPPTHPHSSRFSLNLGLCFWYSDEEGVRGGEQQEEKGYGCGKWSQMKWQKCAWQSLECVCITSCVDIQNVKASRKNLIWTLESREAPAQRPCPLSVWITYSHMFSLLYVRLVGI